MDQPPLLPPTLDELVPRFFDRLGRPFFNFLSFTTIFAMNSLNTPFDVPVLWGFDE
jgi:hypothetical protein